MSYPWTGSSRGDQERLTRARDLRRLALLLLVAASLRFALVEAVFPIAPIGDERHHVDTATHVALGLGYRSHLRNAVAATPPLYPFVLSLAVDVERPPIDPTRVAPRRSANRYVAAERLRPLLRLQALIGTLLVGATALLAGVLFGRRAAALAGGVAAVYPTFLAYSHYLWSTLLFATLLSTGLLLFWRARRSGAWPHWVAAGAVFGLATLTREEALPVAVACCGVFLLGAGAGSRRADVGRAALLLAALVACVSPWTLRNARQLGRLVPVSEVGWMGLAEGNVLSEDGRHADPARVQRFRRAYFAIADEDARAEFARREALAGIAAAQPHWLARKVVTNGAALFRPDSFLLKKLDGGAYGEVAPGLSRALLVASVGSYAAVGSFALLGMAAAAPEVAMLGVAVVAAVAAVHVVANASSRYRVPLMPLLIGFAAHGFLAWRSGTLRLGPRRRALCGSALLSFWAGGAVAFARDFAALWATGHYAPGSG